MSESGDRLSQMRSAFDQAFVLPPRTQAEEVENLLGIRIQGDALALEVAEIAAVERASPIAPLPSSGRGLLGLTGLRGGLLPVYSLPLLLGYDSEPEASRWLVIARTPETLAFAVGRLEGYLRVPKAGLQEGGESPRRHVHRFVEAGSALRGIVSLKSVIATIKDGAGSASGGRR